MIIRHRVPSSCSIVRQIATLLLNCPRTVFILVMAMADDDHVTQRQFDEFKVGYGVTVGRLDKVEANMDTMLVLPTLIEDLRAEAKETTKSINKARTGFIKWLVPAFSTILLSLIGVIVSLVTSDGFNLAATAAKVIK